MLSLFKKQKRLFAVTLFINLLFAVISVAAAKILESILNAVTAENWVLFGRMILVVVIYIVLTGIVLVLSGLISKKLIYNTLSDLREDAYEGIFSRDPQNFQAINTADSISALTNDVKTIEENVLLPFLQSIQYLFVFIMTVIALFYYSPIIAGLMFVCLIIMYLVPASFGKAIGKRQEKLSGNFAMFTAKLKDQLSGYDVIRSFQLSDRSRTAFGENNETLTRAQYAVGRLSAVSEGIAQMLGAAIQLLIMLVSGYMVMHGEMTAGVLLALLQLSGSFVQPVAVVMQSMSMIQGAAPVLARVSALGQRQPTDFNGTERPAFQEHIRFDKVSFGYNADQPVLRDINLRFDKNKKYAILGPNGSGKSTLVKLMSANYGGYEGQITMDGMELRSVRLEEWLEKIAVIQQNVYLFDETIEDNIRLYREYSAEEWQRALAVSGVAKFISQLEMGLKTPVGENGTSLSGGQRQRIAVARAMMRQKPILIFDEGTSAIDTQTAYEIETALLEIPDLTIFTITHHLNPELLRQYDQILYVDSGQICAMGAYDTLLRTSEPFKQFLQSQKRR